MYSFTESNITIEFPDNNFFRFEKILAYQQLSGNHFKEMDFCWFDEQKNIFWLIELKNFSNIDLDKTYQDKAFNLLKKSVDSLSMFLSLKHNYFYSNNFKKEIKVSPNDTTKFNFLNIINCPNAQKANIQHLHDKYRNLFSPYAKLFNIEFYAVVEHQTAIKILKNIVK